MTDRIGLLLHCAINVPVTWHPNSSLARQSLSTTHVIRMDSPNNERTRVNDSLDSNFIDNLKNFPQLQKF